MSDASFEPLRPAAVAGSWYPDDPAELAREVDRYLDLVPPPPPGDVAALIAPHAGLMYSGPVAAYAYGAVRGAEYDAAVLVGPSHFVGFEGVAVLDRGAFDTPFGPIAIDTELADRIRSASSLVHVNARPHEREHALELQLPFLHRVLPGVPIVPLVVGFQERATIIALGDALTDALTDTRPLLIASTDLSHYFDADDAARLDGRVVDLVNRFDADGLLDEFERYSEGERGRYVACGGGAAIAVMRAARALGACEATVLRRADSGDVSGDRSQVVGYMAAIMTGERT